VAGTGQRIALLKLGAPEGAKVGAEKIVLRGVDAKLTAQAAKALNRKSRKFVAQQRRFSSEDPLFA
jgi:hypothetical protein